MKQTSIEKWPLPSASGSRTSRCFWEKVPVQSRGPREPRLRPLPPLPLQQRPQQVVSGRSYLGLGAALGRRGAATWGRRGWRGNRWLAARPTRPWGGKTRPTRGGGATWADLLGRCHRSKGQPKSPTLGRRCAMQEGDSANEKPPPTWSRLAQEQREVGRAACGNPPVGAHPSPSHSLFLRPRSRDLVGANLPPSPGEPPGPDSSLLCFGGFYKSGANVLHLNPSQERRR